MWGCSAPGACRPDNRGMQALIAAESGFDAQAVNGVLTALEEVLTA